MWTQSPLINIPDPWHDTRTRSYLPQPQGWLSLPGKGQISRDSEADESGVGVCAHTGVSQASVWPSVPGLEAQRPEPRRAAQRLQPEAGRIPGLLAPPAVRVSVPQIRVWLFILR